MKRIQTIDILRGIAMIGMVIFHAFTAVGWKSVIEDIYSYPWYIMVPLGLLIYFGSWRGLFLIISGMANAFSFQKAIEKGRSTHILLLTRLLWALVLFLHSLIIQVFWKNAFFNLFLGSNDIWDLSNLQSSDPVEIIAIGILLSTIIQYLFTLGKLRQKSWIAILVFSLLMCFIYSFTPFLTETILGKYGWLEIEEIRQQTVSNFGDRIRWLSLALLVGVHEPLFPYLATFFLGSGLGIALTSPKITKKKVTIIGYSLGFLFIVAAVILGGVDHFSSLDFSEIIPIQWFMHLGTGLQLIAITSFLLIFDFSKKAVRRTRYTKTIRRAGVITLTICTLQSFNFFPQWILAKIFSEPGFVDNSQLLGLRSCFLTAFTVLLFWIGLILLWGLINYTLSLDWIFQLFRNLTSGRKTNLKDPLYSREIIFNPELPFQAENKRN